MSHGVFRRLVLVVSAAALGLFLLSSAAFAQAAPTPTPMARVCDWGHRMWSVPESFHAGAADGYYIWCGPSQTGATDKELHLRTTDKNGVYVYSGTLRTDGTFKDVEKVRDEPDDHVDVADNGHEIKFSFVTYAGIDGFNFNVAGGTKLRYTLDQSGKLISTSNVFLGKEGAHPKHNPVVTHRLRAHSHVAKPAKAPTTATTTTSASTTSASTATGS
jgi:hypothetical protein